MVLRPRPEEPALFVQLAASRESRLAVTFRGPTLPGFLRRVHVNTEVLGIEVTIWKMPVEIVAPIPFDKDHTHASYDAARVEKFWRILVAADEVFKVFCSRFIGKCSPVHFSGEAST